MQGVRHCLKTPLSHMTNPYGDGAKASHTVSVDRFEPETLSVNDQVNLFRNAQWLAGCSGTNMFNCAFSGLDQRKFLLTSRNYILHTDVLMNIRSRHPITYFVGEPERGHDQYSPWQVDLDLLGEAVDKWLGSKRGPDGSDVARQQRAAMRNSGQPVQPARPAPASPPRRKAVGSRAMLV
jgi:hypothetical protein